jgi:hypothetical protein
MAGERGDRHQRDGPVQGPHDEPIPVDMTKRSVATKPAPTAASMPRSARTRRREEKPLRRGGNGVNLAGTACAGDGSREYRGEQARCQADANEDGAPVPDVSVVR